MKMYSLMGQALVLTVLTGCMSVNECGKKVEDANNSVVRAEFDSLDGSLHVLYAMEKSLAPNKKPMNILRREMNRHLVFLSMMKLKIPNLSDSQIETLCIARQASEVGYFDAVEVSYIKSISEQLDAEIRERQSRFGGKVCLIGGANGVEDNGFLRSKADREERGRSK